MHKKAFSLIELSIVILVIAILIAGVTQSSRLINSFRLSNARTITQSSPVTGTPDLVSWHETTMEDSLDAADQENNTSVDNWYDRNPQSSKKINLTQATSNLQPKFITSAMNNLPALQFDGNTSTGDYLTSSTYKITDFIKNDEVTIFIAMKLSSTANNSIFMLHDTLGAGDNRINIHAPEGGYLRFDFGACCVDSIGRISVTSPSNFSFAPKIMTLHKKSTLGVIRVNGSAILSNAMTASFSSSTLNSTAYFDVGRIGYDSTYSLNGYIGEIIFFKRALKSAEIIDIENYLGKKWGVTF